jgi:hypothetical protein
LAGAFFSTTFSAFSTFATFSAFTSLTSFVATFLAGAFFSTAFISAGSTFTIVFKYFLPSNLTLFDFENLTIPSTSACIE